MTLERMGHEVLGVDLDPALVQEFAPGLARVVEADCTDPETLKRLGIAGFEAAVVAIGTDIEASVLTVLALTDLGFKNIWAKATNDRHARILERTGGGSCGLSRTAHGRAGGASPQRAADRFHPVRRRVRDRQTRRPASDRGVYRW